MIFQKFRDVILDLILIANPSRTNIGEIFEI